MNKQPRVLRWARLRAAECLFATLLTLLALTSLSAQEFKVGDLKLEQVWSRATPTGAKVGAGYLTITNTGTQPDRLVGATTPVSARVEVHEMSMTGGIMRMQRLAKGLVIPPGETVVLKPGGYHIMFMQLTTKLQKDKPFRVTLEFERAGKIDVEFQVAAIGASSPSNPHAGSHSGAHNKMKH